jgi:hypothetical protein
MLRSRKLVQIFGMATRPRNRDACAHKYSRICDLRVRGFEGGRRSQLGLRVDVFSAKGVGEAFQVACQFRHDPLSRAIRNDSTSAHHLVSARSLPADLRDNAATRSAARALLLENWIPDKAGGTLFYESAGDVLNTSPITLLAFRVGRINEYQFREERGAQRRYEATAFRRSLKYRTVGDCQRHCETQGSASQGPTTRDTVDSLDKPLVLSKNMGVLRVPTFCHRNGLFLAPIGLGAPDENVRCCSVYRRT